MADQPDDLPEVVHQPPLAPTMELPEYHGRKAVGMKTGVSGAGNRISRPHSLGDRVVAVIELKVKSAGHEETDDGLVYVEKVKVVDFFEVQGDAGRRLLSTMRQAHRAADDDANGRAPLSDDLGAAGVTDASGVALTPEELASLHGNDPVRAMLDETLTPVVVVYADGGRELWPDDFDSGVPRPNLGDFFFGLVGLDLPDDREMIVRQLLDATTGETLAGPLSDEEVEAARQGALLELEAKALEIELENKALADLAGPDDPEYVEPDTADDGKGEPFPDGPASVTFEGDAPDDEIEVDADEDLADVVPIGTPAADLVDALEETGPVLPSLADFAFVDRPVSDIASDVADIDDRDRLARYYAAEEQGRGRGLKARKTALEAIEKRIGALAENLDDVAAPDLPEEPEGFEPDEATDFDDFDPEEG